MGTVWPRQAIGLPNGRITCARESDLVRILRREPVSEAVVPASGVRRSSSEYRYDVRRATRWRGAQVGACGRESDPPFLLRTSRGRGRR